MSLPWTATHCLLAISFSNWGFNLQVEVPFIKVEITNAMQKKQCICKFIVQVKGVFFFLKMAAS